MDILILNYAFIYKHYFDLKSLFNFTNFENNKIYSNIDKMPKNRNCQKQFYLHNLIFWSYFQNYEVIILKKCLKSPKKNT